MQSQSAESLYRQIGSLLATKPEIEPGLLNQEACAWLARAFALVEVCGDSYDRIKMRQHVDSIASSVYGDDMEQIDMILYRRLAVLEMQSPAEMRGAFIAVGQEFTALQAVSKVLRLARDEILIVDPYFSVDALNDYVQMADPSVLVKVLVDGKAAQLNAALKVGAERWSRQFHQERRLEVRVSSQRTLHDRLIVVDRLQTFLLSQSLAKLADRSPASLQKADREIHDAKFDAYNTLWAIATPL